MVVLLAASALGLHRHVERSAPLADVFHLGGWSLEKEAAFRAIIADVDHRFRALVAERLTHRSVGRLVPDAGRRQADRGLEGRHRGAG